MDVGKETAKTGKILSKNFILGIIAILAITGISAVGNLVGMSGAVANAGGFGQAIGSHNVGAIIWIFISLALTGAVVAFCYKLSNMLDKYLHLAKEANVPESHHKMLTRVVGFFLFGILVTVVIGALNLFIQGVNKGINITNIGSLQQAIMTGNMIVFVGSVVAMAVVGFLAIKIRPLESKIEDGLKSIDNIGKK